MSEQRTDTQEGAQPAAGAAIGAAVRSGQPAHPTAAALAEWRGWVEEMLVSELGEACPCRHCDIARALRTLAAAYEAERARGDAALMLLRECREHVEVSRDASQQDRDLYRGYAREAQYQAEVDEAKALLDRIDAALAPEGAAK